MIAKTVPTVIAAGKAGGTVIVTKSNDLSIIAAASYPYSIINGKVPKNPRIAKTPIEKINFKES